MLDRTDLQRRINAVSWYHEFEFPNGLVARSTAPRIADHRRIWAHIKRQLDAIDFCNKTVLDLGCWDGYWSFYAEQRGARRVFATDDSSQNWARSSGILLAKELLNSSIEVRLDVSIYELTKLREMFDIVLCLGIYYHLVDPFHAFSQVRHCCAPGSIAVFEGDILCGPQSKTLRFDLSDHTKPIFVPSRSVLTQLLNATYFETLNQSTLPTPAWKRLIKHTVLSEWTERQLLVCRPVETNNSLHAYRPPFELERYDFRFKEPAKYKPL